jgi:UDP-GlcNAc:undecaprenyl-phosphate GlcNAc-1-phosphate transferase
MSPRTSLLFVFATIVPGLVVSFLCGFVVRRWAPRFGLVDKPGGRKNHAQPTPLGGGISVWLGVTLSFVIGICVLLVLRSRPELQENVPEFARPHLPGLFSRLGDLAVVLIGGTALMILGLLDDRFGLPWQPRLGFQLLIAAICVFTQGNDWQLTAFIPLRPITWTLSAIWIVVLINSFNFLDNMDGLSAGIAAIASTMLAAFLLFPPASSAEGPQLFVSGFLLVLAGSLLGFLWHNRSPARLFLGDAGSYFVGFSIGVATLVATYTSYESNTQHAILAPLCVMAVPLYDMVTVLAIRWREGRSLFQGDRCHFSHRLVDLGFTRGRAVLTIYLMTAICGLAALLLHRVDRAGAVIVALLVASMLLLIQLIEFTARRKRQS